MIKSKSNICLDKVGINVNWKSFIILGRNEKLMLEDVFIWIENIIKKVDVGKNIMWEILKKFEM